MGAVKHLRKNSLPASPSPDQLIFVNVAGSYVQYVVNNAGVPVPPAVMSHGHAISDITGLQTALDGKAALSHTHANATTSASGFMSIADKTKLDGLANYTHPTSGVTPGTYSRVTVNAQGHVTGGTTPATLSALGITEKFVSVNPNSGYVLDTVNGVALGSIGIASSFYATGATDFPVGSAAAGYVSTQTTGSTSFVQTYADPTTQDSFWFRRKNTSITYGWEQFASRSWVSSAIGPSRWTSGLDSPPSKNLNTTDQGGLWTFGTDVTNAPVAYGTLINFVGASSTPDAQSSVSSWTNQLVWSTGNQLYFRQRIYTYGSWSSWERIWTSLDLTAGRINGWDLAYGWGNHASFGYASTAALASGLAGKENTFTKGDIVQGSNVTLTGSLAGRLVGSGNIAISAAAADLSGYVLNTRTITINGVPQTLAADRSWTVTMPVTNITDGNEAQTSGFYVNQGAGTTNMPIGYGAIIQVNRITGSGTTSRFSQILLDTYDTNPRMYLRNQGVGGAYGSWVQMASQAWVTSQSYATNATVAGYTPAIRSLTINGVTQDFQFNRTYAVSWASALTVNSVTNVMPVISIANATTTIEYMKFQPTDFGAGKPYLALSKNYVPNKWEWYCYDGSSTSGQMNFALTLTQFDIPLVDHNRTITINGITKTLAANQIWDIATGSAPTYSQVVGALGFTPMRLDRSVTINGVTFYVNDNPSGSVGPSSISGANSISGGGSSGAISLQLQGDVSSPGGTAYYGTNSGGTKGWYGLPASSGGTVTDVYGQNSISGGGGSGTIYLQLQNDTNTPGGNKLYGTNSGGTKGWYDQPSGGSAPTYAQIISALGFTPMNNNRYIRINGIDGYVNDNPDFGYLSGGGIGGGGTTNCVPLWSSGSSLGNSPITYSGGLTNVASRLDANEGLCPGSKTQSQRLSMPIASGYMVYQSDGAQPGLWMYKSSGWVFIG